MPQMKLRAAPLAIAALVMTGCNGDEIGPSAEAPSPQDDFFDALSSHCGKAYAGELVSEEEADADFAEAAMVMHVAECSEDRIAVPFHVQLDGEWDRSRTWVFTRVNSEDGDGLRLKHDHRHEDGEPDAVTMYGGDTADEGISRAKEFPVDDESIAMFEREGLTASVTNVWRVEVDPAGTDNAQFAYQLRRTVETGAPEDRFFRVEFDLTREVEPPPPSWGWE